MALTLPKSTSSSVDLQDPTTRQYILDQLGQEQPTPKASFLERVGSLLSFTETGNAAYTLAKTGNPLEAFKTYGSDIFKGVTGAFTGNIDKDKKTYSDVLKYIGIDNNLVSDVGGLVLDVAIDPFTYLSAGTKAGVEIGGKTLTTKGAKVFNNAKLRSAMDIASELGIKVGKSDDVIDLLRKAPTDDFIKATNKIAKKAGIPLVSPVTDIKLVPQILETLGKQRLNKVFKLTGADLVKEVGAEGAKAVQEAGEIFASPSLRFAGKELFTLSDKGSTLAKAVVDPVSLGLETASKSKHIKPLFAKAKGLLNTFKSSGRSLFDTTYDASMIGLKNYNADIKQLHRFVDNIVGKTGENADEVMKVMSTVMDSPHLLPELVERTSWLDGEALSDLQRFYTKVDNISENSFLRFFGAKSALKDASLKAKGDAFIKAWDARDIDMLNQIVETVPSKSKLGKAMKKKLEKAASNNFKWMEIAGHYELNENIGIAKLAKEIQGDIKGSSLPFITSAKERQKVFKDLGLRNVNDHLTRFAVGKSGEYFDEAGYVIPSKFKDTYDIDKILGSRVYDMMAQGRSEGEVMYAIDKVVKGRAWDALSKAEQKKARAEITAIVVSTEAKFQAAKAYHHFLTYTKDAVNDAGERLLTKLDELDDTAIDLLRKKGYRKIKRTGKMLNGYIAPPEVANMLENTYKTLFDPDQTNGFLKAFDKVTGMWKQSVTSWFPAFHIRNGMSNIFANTMAGVTNPKRYFEAKKVQQYMNLSAKHGVSEKVLRKAGNKKIGNYTIAEIVDFADQHSIIGAGTYFDEISEGLAKTRPGQIKKFNPLSKDFVLTSTGSTIGNYVEGNAKLALFIDQLRKGHGIEDSANMVKKVLFDYSDLTDFEKNVMRRVIPFYCVPTDTEILTQEGWKNYDEINKGSTVMTFNTSNKGLEWQPVEDIAVFDFDGELERMQQRKYDFLYTQDHRFPVYNHKDELSIKRAYELNTGDKIPLVGNYTNTKNIIGERLAAIIGWIVTDGYIRQRGNHTEMVIYQTPKKYLDEILELVGEDGTPGKPHPDNNTVPVYLKASLVDQIKIHINRKEDVEKLVGKLSIHEAQAMWNAMFKADGNTRDDKSYQFLAQSTRPEVLNAFQILTIMIGKTANLGDRGCYIKKNKRIKVASTLRTKKYYKGKIWCPKTKNSTWIMRRNGAVLISGNTWTRKNAEFMTRYAVANPGKFSIILKGFRDIQTSLSDIPDEDIEKLPAWARAGFSVISGSGKDASVITGFGTPIEAFGEFMDSFTNSRTRTFLNFIGPIPRGIIEKATGVSLFTGKQLKNDTDGQKFRQLPGFIKDAIGYKEIQRQAKDGSSYIEYIINPNTKWILNMFAGRSINETSKLLETIDDPSAVQALNLLTGIKRYQFNIDEEQAKREREAAQLLLDMLIAEGLGKEYTIGGLTKEAKVELGLSETI